MFSGGVAFDVQAAFAAKPLQLLALLSFGALVLRTSRASSAAPTPAHASWRNLAATYLATNRVFNLSEGDFLLHI